jgi:adenylate cyclase
MADVRGYTALTEGLSPLAVTELANRFYEAGSAALLAADGLLGQIEGDLVMGLFVPGLAGKGVYRRKAVEGGLGLLEAIGYGQETGNWLDVGIGIATGEEFVGNVGGGGYKDFTALGDVTNTAARLSSAAAAGEILMDAETYGAVADRHPHAERRLLDLKGKSEPVEAVSLQVSAGLAARSSFGSTEEGRSKS